MPRDAVTVRRNGAYAPLSASYADDDAIATLDEQEDDRTELLFLRGLAYCARTPETNGLISAVALRTGRILRRRPSKKARGTDEIRDVIWHAEQLVKVGLWTAETDGYRISSWSKWNRSAEEIEAKRSTDAARKRAARAGDDDA